MKARGTLRREARILATRSARSKWPKAKASLATRAVALRALADRLDVEMARADADCCAYEARGPNALHHADMASSRKALLARLDEPLVEPKPFNDSTKQDTG